MAVKADDLGAVEQAVEVGEVERGRRASTGIQRSSMPFSACELVPRDDVGVVLELGEHDGVAGARGWPGPRPWPPG